jgi:HAD superfamily hydrolase (TIGR01549 family)
MGEDAGKRTVFPLMRRKRKANYEAIIFDVGDTLLTREPPDHEILAERLGRIGVSIGQDSARWACKQIELWMCEQILREMQGAPGISDEEFRQWSDIIALQTVFDDIAEDKIRQLFKWLKMIPYPKQVWVLAVGVHRTLTRLKDMDFKLGIASNFGEMLFDLCDEFGLTPYFDTIVPSSRIGVEKPDPEILKVTCRRLDVSPSASLYAGDHPFDVLCAKKAGMSAAWLCEPSDEFPDGLRCEPDYHIHSIADILNIC